MFEHTEKRKLLAMTSIVNLHKWDTNTRDSSVGRAEDCRWVTEILRSVVQIRLAGIIFYFYPNMGTALPYFLQNFTSKSYFYI